MIVSYTHLSIIQPTIQYMMTLEKWIIYMYIRSEINTQRIRALGTLLKWSFCFSMGEFPSSCPQSAESMVWTMVPLGHMSKQPCTRHWTTPSSSLACTSCPQQFSIKYIKISHRYNSPPLLFSILTSSYWYFCCVSCANPGKSFCHTEAENALIFCIISKWAHCCS